MITKTLSLGIICLLLFLTACNAGPNASSPKSGNVSGKLSLSRGYTDIDNAKLAELMHQGIPVVDIRLKEEWQQTGIIKGSKTLTFFDKTGRINPDFVTEFTTMFKPEQAVALICRTGNRTRAASQAIAQQLGYKKVYNVKHGISGWMAEKRPVVKYRG